jgi:hypothetical protein
MLHHLPDDQVRVKMNIEECISFTRSCYGMGHPEHINLDYWIRIYDIVEKLNPDVYPAELVLEISAAKFAILDEIQSKEKDNIKIMGKFDALSLLFMKYEKLN